MLMWALKIVILGRILIVFFLILINRQVLLMVTLFTFKKAQQTGSTNRAKWERELCFH